MRIRPLRYCRKMFFYNLVSKMIVPERFQQCREAETGSVLCFEYKVKMSIKSCCFRELLTVQKGRNGCCPLQKKDTMKPSISKCLFQGVCNSVERQKWVLSSAVESYLKVGCPIQLFNRVSLTVQKGRNGCCLLQDKTSIEKCFFSRGVCNSVEGQKWVLSAAVERYLKVVCPIYHVEEGKAYREHDPETKHKNSKERFEPWTLTAVHQSHQRKHFLVIFITIQCSYNFLISSLVIDQAATWLRQTDIVVYF